MSLRLPHLLLAAALLTAHAQAEPTATPAPAAETDPAAAEAIRQAKIAMEAWLALIEEGKYIDSWKTASKPFQDSIGAGRWAMTCRNQRRPTGKLLTRDLAEEHFHKEHYDQSGRLRPGEIVTFLFTTRFEHLDEAREAVILRPFEGEWKVVSYALRPTFKKPPAETPQ